MPRIQIRTPTTQDYLYDKSYEAYGRAGQALQSGLENASAQREARRRSRYQHEEDMRRLDVEEQRAKASLVKEANALAKTQGVAEERDADRQAVVTGLAEIGAQQAGRAREEQVRNALASPEGLLGPFGMAKALAKGAPDTMAVEQRMAGKIELAKRMSPAAGRMFLERESEAEKQAILAQGYEEEFKALDNAIKDGKFEDPFLTPSKPGAAAEPSDQAMAKAELYAKALQESLAAGRPPGPIHQRLAKDYDLHAKLSARKAGWEAADLRAKEVLDQMRELANLAPDGFDPNTGKSIRGELIERLAIARDEWQRTSGISHRRSTDPAKELGELSGLLFRAQAEQSPEGFLQAANDAATAKGPAQQEADMAMATGPGAPVAAGMAPRQTAQAAPGAKGAAGGSVPRGTPAKAPHGGKRAAGKPGAKPTEKNLARMRSFVMERAGAVLEQGGDRAAALAELRAAIEQELGLDTDTDEVDAVLREALQRAAGRSAVRQRTDGP